jgi:hypothetical protein
MLIAAIAHKKHTTARLQLATNDDKLFPEGRSAATLTNLLSTIQEQIFPSLRFLTLVAAMQAHFGALY